MSNIDFTGNPGSVSRPIGTIAIPAGTARDASYETASWWQEVAWEAQTVTLWSNGYYVSYGVECVVTDGYFGGGGRTGAGTTRRYSWNPYVHAWALAHAEGRTEGVTLAPEYGVRVEDTGETYGDTDRPILLGRLTMPESGHPLTIERDYSADQGGGTSRELHAWRWAWRGEDRGTFTVDRLAGFNGDTSAPAMRHAVALLKGTAPNS